MNLRAKNSPWHNMVWPQKTGLCSHLYVLAQKLHLFLPRHRAYIQPIEEAEDQFSYLTKIYWNVLQNHKLSVRQRDRPFPLTRLLYRLPEPTGASSEAKDLLNHLSSTLYQWLHIHPMLRHQ